MDAGTDTEFLSTPSVGRATAVQRLGDAVDAISIHALRGEGDFEGHVNDRKASQFLSTPSVGRATGRGAQTQPFGVISIHALRGEGDRPTVSRWRPVLYFYPRPPWGGRRPNRCCPSRKSYFYPRPPWGGRPRWARTASLAQLFLSTPSVGRATGHIGQPHRLRRISIHALRGEGDPAPRKAGVAGVISIHALRGEGDIVAAVCEACGVISIHALRGEGDWWRGPG